VSFYDALKETAVKLLEEFGQDCPIVRTDPESGILAEMTTSAIRDARVRHVSNFAGGVEVGDWRILAAATVTPEIGDRITVDTEELVIVAVEAIKPAAIVLAWFIWGRAG
jgi:hypothetical protein